MYNPLDIIWIGEKEHSRFAWTLHGKYELRVADVNDVNRNQNVSVDLPTKFVLVYTPFVPQFAYGIRETTGVYDEHEMVVDGVETHHASVLKQLNLTKE